MVHLYLARHGETIENATKILQGHLPGHLNEKGKRQAAELRNKLMISQVRFDGIVVSDLQRALDTVEIVNETFALPVTTTPLLRERDWGSLTGISLSNRHIETFPDDIESIEALFQRAAKFLQYVLTDFEGKTILAVGHGLFNRCILASISGQTIQDIPAMKNAEIREIILNDNSFSKSTADEIPATN